MKKKKIFAITLAALLVWNIILTLLIVNGTNSKTTVTEENVYGISTDLTTVAKDVYSSVVGVKTSYGNETGFIYKQNDNIAYIVTTYHGIGKDSAATVSFANGKTVSASVVGYDFKRDIAVLSFDSPYLLNVVKCGDNEYTKNGEFIICISSSNNKDITNDVNLGIVSNNLIDINDEIVFERKKYSVQKEMIALSLNTKEGYSGSPIFNMKNEIIGMIQLNDDERAYSLTINEIKLIAEKIINNEEINKIDLGIKGKYISNFEDYDRNMLNISFDVTNGYYVNNVAFNSIGNKLDIRASDVILSINNAPIKGQKDLLNCLYSNSNDEITIQVYREGNTLTLKGNIND